MKFADLLYTYNEIISKEDWNKNNYVYKNTFKEGFDNELYKHSSKYITKLFKKMNNGKLEKTLVFDYESTKAKRLNEMDISLINELLELGYQVDKISYQSGIVKKDGKDKNIYDVLSSFVSKKKDKMMLQKENEVIKKQINFIVFLETKGLLKNKKIVWNKLSIFDKKDMKIVITYDHRAIASQSTEVGWSSCMNLKDGIYKDQVGSGASAGVFVAYFVKPGDEYELKKPTARVLIKPYYNKNQDIYFLADKIYGTAPLSFKKQVQKIIDKYQEAGGDDIYELHDNVYDDGGDRFYIKNKDKLKKELEKIIDDENYFYDCKSYNENFTKLLIEEIKEKESLGKYNIYIIFKKFKNISTDLQIYIVNALPLAFIYIDNANIETISRGALTAQPKQLLNKINDAKPVLNRLPKSKKDYIKTFLINSGMHKTDVSNLIKELGWEE